MNRGKLIFALGLGLAALLTGAAPASAFNVQACYKACNGNRSCQENCENRQFEDRAPSRSKEVCTVRNGRQECVVKPVFQ